MRDGSAYCRRHMPRRGCGVGAGGEKRRSRCPCARAAGMRRKTLHSLGYGRRVKSACASRLYRKQEQNSVRLKSGIKSGKREELRAEKEKNQERKKRRIKIGKREELRAELRLEFSQRRCMVIQKV